MNKPNLGAHVSAAGGFYKAIERAEALGATAIQIFGASPRQWKAKLPNEEDVERYKEVLGQSKVKSVYLHASYLVNLGTPDEELYKRSIENLSAHFEIANMIGAKGLVFHIGSAKGSDRKSAIERIVKGMRTVLKNVRGGSYLIMENASGGGDKIGATAEEIGKLLKSVQSNRVKTCLDTAHVFEAGEIRYTVKEIKEYFNVWDEKIGLSNLVVIHANDSKTEHGSNTDRHDNIGEGYIGLNGFRNLVKKRELWDKDWILEVPGFDGEGPDKKNLDILKSLF